MQLNGILSYNYTSSLVAVRMYLIQIHPDSDQRFRTLCPIFIDGTYTSCEDGTEYRGVAYKLFLVVKSKFLNTSLSVTSGSFARNH